MIEEERRRLKTENDSEETTPSKPIEKKTKYFEYTILFMSYLVLLYLISISSTDTAKNVHIHNIFEQYIILHFFVHLF